MKHKANNRRRSHASVILDANGFAAVAHGSGPLSNQAGTLLLTARSTHAASARSRTARRSCRSSKPTHPKVGEPLPDVTIYDDLGNPVNLRELADENYKVLVLGCLT